MAYIFILLIYWISFFPESVQRKYYIYVRLFLMAIFFIVLIKRRDIRFIFNRNDIFLWITLACFSLGIVSAIDKPLAIRTYLDVALPLCFLYFISKYVFEREEYLSHICIAISLSCLIIAIIGTMELVFGRNLIYELFVKNYYYKWYIGKRPMATQDVPAILGSILLGFLVFGFHLIRNKVFIIRLLGWLSIPVSVIMVILTGSRAALLGLILLFLFYTAVKKRYSLAAFFLVTMLFFISLCSFFNNPNLNRLGFKNIIYGSRGGVDGVFSEYRMERFNMTVSMLKDHPFTGIGLSHFRKRFDEYNILRKNISHIFKIADNMYLTILAETGIFGFLSFMIFSIFLIKNGIKSYNGLNDDNKKEIILIAMSGLIAFLVGMGGYELFYWHNPLALFSIFCGMISSQILKK